MIQRYRQEDIWYGDVIYFIYGCHTRIGDNDWKGYKVGEQMNIALIICIPVCIIATGFFMLKAVHMGLRWQYDNKHDQVPAEVKTPVSAILDSAKEKKQDEVLKYTKEMIQEWSPFQEAVKK